MEIYRATQFDRCGVGVAVNIREKIHTSHKLDINDNTIVGERFATTFECQMCGYSGYETVAGARLDIELQEPCELGDRREYLKYHIDKAKRQLDSLVKELTELEG